MRHTASPGDAVGFGGVIHATMQRLEGAVTNWPTGAFNGGIRYSEEGRRKGLPAPTRRGSFFGLMSFPATR